MSLIETDTLSNQDISSELEIASLTAGAYYPSVQIHIYLDQIAGNGDYTIAITHQLGGAGTAYRTVDITQTVNSGVTSLKASTYQYAINSADIIKVLVTGLAGDTTTVDTRVEFHDASANTELITLSATTPIESNLKQINDTALTGDGSATPWGPA